VAVDLFGQTIFLLLTVQMAMVEIRVAHRSEVVPIQTFKQVVAVAVPEELVRTQLLDQAVMVVQALQVLILMEPPVSMAAAVVVVRETPEQEVLGRVDQAVAELAEKQLRQPRELQTRVAVAVVLVAIISWAAQAVQV
jgi:hypothetical protein